jgi:hypothetical protein
MERSSHSIKGPATPRQEAESSSKRSDALGRERQMTPIV